MIDDHYITFACIHQGGIKGQGALVSHRPTQRILTELSPRVEYHFDLDIT